MNGIDKKDIQPSKAYINRHKITDWSKDSMTPGLVMTFRIFFNDQRYCSVWIYRSEEHLRRQFPKLECPGDHATGAFVPEKTNPKNPKFFGGMGFHLPYCDDGIVPNIMTSAAMAWVNEMATPKQICTLRGIASSPHVVLAKEIGELVDQFWKCFSVVRRRKRPWERRYDR